MPYILAIKNYGMKVLNILTIAECNLSYTHRAKKKSCL